MGKDRILAVDIGSQSVRAMVFDGNGVRLAKAQRATPTPLAPQPGWAETDAEQFWMLTCAACREIWRAQPDLRGSIVAMSVTTQRASVVALDPHGRPLRPAILWSDKRITREMPALTGTARLVGRLPRLGSFIDYMRHRAPSNWLAIHEPETWARTAQFLLLSGYIHFRLTGEFRDSVGSQVGIIPFDYRRQDWAGPHNWRWGALGGIRREQLPDLVQQGGILGAICAAAAADCGLEPGTPVVAAAADKACESLGAGATATGSICLSYGTAATVNMLNERYIEADRFLPAYPAAVPGKYSTEVQVYRGFWLLRWFKEEFAHNEIQMARRMGVEPEALLDELLAGIPAGASGLIAQPYWSPGMRTPGPEARGSIIGFGDHHRRGHVYRVLVEGLVYALRDGAERISRRSRHRIHDVRVAGGGARSDTIMQLTADIFGTPAARPAEHESSALGAAICAAVGAGLHPDFDSAVSAMSRIDTQFEPDPATQQMYEALYRRVYKKLYKRLQPLYHALQEIVEQNPV